MVKTYIGWMQERCGKTQADPCRNVRDRQRGEVRRSSREGVELRDDGSSREGMEG